MTFDVEKTVRYWLDGAAYDIETGRSLLESKKFPYALFFGHLTLEKTLKALIVKTTGEHAPYSHSLTFLASKAGIDIPEAIIDQLAEYMEFHLEARYPDDRKTFYDKCNEDFSHKKFSEIKDVYTWLIRKLEI